MGDTADILRSLLVQVGVADAQSLRSDIPLVDQGLNAALVFALTHAVETRYALDSGELPLAARPSLDDFSAALSGRKTHQEQMREALEEIEKNRREVPPGLSYQLDRLRPEDAPGVAQLFYTVYADKYPVVDYYVPTRLARLNREGRVVTVVARLEDGSIAGQGAYFQSSPPNKALYEYGQILILPAYRNSSMAASIARYMDELSYTLEQVQGFMGEAVTNHPVTQNLCLRQGYSTCGLEVALMPTGAYAKEGAKAKRVGCVLETRVDHDRPGPMFLPERYRPELERILAGFTLRRDIVFSSRDAPAQEESLLEERTFDFAQLTRIQVHSVGRDFPERLAALDQRSAQQGLAVSQVFVNTARPGTAFAVEALRRAGYFFGALLPLWFGTDGLLMQKLWVEPEFDTLTLVTDTAKALTLAIRADWERAQGQMK